MSDKLNLEHSCPVCRKPMHPLVLGCECGVRVEGPILVNEFASLNPELLHLLRIFVLCEGRIRDMEASLGISYPTVKTKIRELKAALHLDDEESPEPTDDLTDVIDQLESGELSADEALKKLTR